jgi:hypothetical protein
MDADTAAQNIQYKYDEPTHLEALKQYIDSTYKQHYASKSSTQVTEYIVKQRNSPEFLIGCAVKYLSRYGMKDGYNAKDLLKALHTTLQALYFHYELDMENREHT